jgi:hypothetical protein
VLAAVGGAAAVAVVASAAGAVTTPAKVYSKDISGYSTTRWVRYNQVTFNLPSNTQCAQAFAARSPQGAGLAITLGPAEESNAGVPLSAGAASTLGVSFVPAATGCGLISPSFASNLSGTTVAEPLGSPVLNPGDSVTLSLYYSQGGKFTEAVVVDNTNGSTAHGSFDGAATYAGGSITGGFGPYTPAGGKAAKLWAVKASAMTTYTGVHSAIGSFAPHQIVMTSDGTVAGTVYANPGVLWNGGTNFSIFVH